MSGIFIAGLGAVSPAGWTVASLREALGRGLPFASQPLERPGWNHPLKVLTVPPPVPRPVFLGHQRLRRTSPITHYAAAAALEAAGRLRACKKRSSRIGLVLCLQSGCVQYTQRFFSEVIKDPATASPVLFPETVFAAPASHVAALLENVAMVYTLIGDPASFLSGFNLGMDWLRTGLVDACLVVGAEETNWLLADALWHFEHATILSGGAGAVCLSADRELSIGVGLDLITKPRTYLRGSSREKAARAMRSEFPPEAAGELLCDGCGASHRTSLAEKRAWEDWKGARLSPKRVLGEGLMAAAAWQCVAACDAVAGGTHKVANVSLVGCNEQAIGARFIHVERNSAPPPPKDQP